VAPLRQRRSQSKRQKLSRQAEMREHAPSYEGAIKSNGGAAQEAGPPKEKEMGYQGCPCYRDYFLKYGEYCDRNGQSCADCPLLEVARKKSGN
jgi:hypothetical protein